MKLFWMIGFLAALVGGDSLLLACEPQEIREDIAKSVPVSLEKPNSDQEKVSGISVKNAGLPAAPQSQPASKEKPDMSWALPFSSFLGLRGPAIDASNNYARYSQHIAEKRAEARAEGIEKGRAEARAETLQSALSLLRDNTLTMEKASVVFQLTPEEQSELSETLNPSPSKRPRMDPSDASSAGAASSSSSSPSSAIDP